MDEEIEIERFDFCKKTDLHALDTDVDIKTVVSIACEHGFRGIVVQTSKIEELVKEINKNDKSIIPISAIDYPFGTSSTDIRTYSIFSSKEKGAKEVEIIAPYPVIAKKDFHKIYEDMQGLVNASEKTGLYLRYVIDQNSPYVDESIRTKLCRTISATKIKAISTSIEACDELDEKDHSDAILMMRNLKSKTNCTIKCFVNTNSADKLALYPKAGADTIGMLWNKSANVVHGYEYLMQDLKKAK
jgi:deoxyribose-phosphate aldolase